MSRRAPILASPPSSVGLDDLSLQTTAQAPVSLLPQGYDAAVEQAGLGAAPMAPGGTITRLGRPDALLKTFRGLGR